MRVPDDVTLLWAEDNWGNLRRLPTAEERKRTGGAGIYYHFDYHGGPRNYQWINTSPIPKIWDQMSLAKQYGADRIWIVNVGHFKGYEFPMEFFHEPGAGTRTRWTNDESRRIHAALGGSASSARSTPTKSPTSLPPTRSSTAGANPSCSTPNTYSLVNYDEFDKVVADYEALADKAEKISENCRRKAATRFTNWFCSRRKPARD